LASKKANSRNSLRLFLNTFVLPKVAFAGYIQSDQIAMGGITAAMQVQLSAVKI